ncbi:hypothetical protein M8J75_005574 [Diaphorina citri]|nr:hypothetical protein M8J75_005574 [Diaphorina citri]
MSEEKSVATLVQDLCSCIWNCEHQTESQSVTHYELSNSVRKRMVSKCFDVLLNQKHLCQGSIKSTGEQSLSYLLFQHFYKRGHCDDHDRELYSNYITGLEHITSRYEAADAVFTVLAALSGSKPRRQIKTNEMLSCFYFGTLKHCVPPDQRSQTLQDQFSILRNDTTVYSLPSGSSYSTHNPFRIPRHFESSAILLQAPVLNVNVPRTLNIPEPNSQIIHQYPQDEGYVTPDSANILEDQNSRDTSGKKHWPQPKSITYSNLPSWNGLENLAAPKEKDFVLDFQQRSSTNNTGLHLIQVLQAGKETPRLSQTKLFTHLRDQEQFTMDLKYLLMGTPSHCFPYDKDKNQFTCAYGIFTDDVSPEFLVKYLEPALQCGNYAYLLKHLVRDKKKGYVYLSFQLCIQEYLRSYDSEVLSHLSEESHWHYMELQNFITTCYRRLSCLARIWKPEDHLLNHIYSQALDTFCTNQNAELNLMVARIFECCTNTYFELLEKWLFRGDCHESLVTQSTCHSFKSRLFWVKGFRFNRVQCPVFLLDYEDQIFACGKNICLLKLTNPEDPLFSIDVNRIPQLKCYLSKTSVEEFHIQCKQYEESVLRACGGAPQFAKLLMPLEYSQEQLRQWQEQARVKREVYIQKLQEERLKKRELQAEQRRKWLQEIEIIEQRKKQEKENELRQDLKIMEEAKRLDEEYVRVKEQEKQKIEEYYRSLMEIIEKRHEHVKSKTQSLETLRTILKNKVDKEKSVLDATDGKLDTQSCTSVDKLGSTSEKSLTGTPSQTSTSSVLSSESSTAESLFTLDIPEPPNVELLMKKIEEEEETILLTRETQKRLDDLKANRMQARVNRNKILSCEFNICTGEKTAKPAEKFDLKEKYMEGNTSSANQEAISNKAKSQGSDMGDCMRNDEQTGRKEKPLSKNTERPLSKETEQTLSKETQNILDTRQSAMLIKQKVLSAEYNINVTTHPVIDAPEGRLCDNSGHKSRDIHDGTTRDVQASTTREPNVHSTKVENKVLTAHEEAVRNRSKVLSHEFHLEVKEGQPRKSNIGDISDANQEAKNNRERSQGGSDMNQCMRNVITETSKDPIQTCTPSVLVDPHPSELSSSIGPSTKESTDQELTDDPMTTSHSVTSSSENLVTIISKEEQSSEETQEETAKTSPPRGYVLETKQSHYKINTAWTFNSLIDENEDLDVTLVQKYLERSIRIPLYIQYRLTNDAVLRLFLNKHHLATHLITLRNYFFLLDGSFAKSLTHDLSKQIRNNLVLLLNPFKLNSILRKAVSYGTCDTKMENNLTFVIKNYDTISSLQESNVFQYISLSYKVEWPLNIVLTPEALTNYDKVFVFLMQVQQVSHTLQQVFVYLKLRRKFEMNNLYIYRQVNLFRHVMMQVLSAVQSYIHCSVLELPWHDMVEAFKKPVTLDSVYYRHVEYVKQIIFRCLLNKRSRALTEALNAMFKTILDFYEELKKRSPEKNYENLLAIFQKFLKISLYFHDYCKRMSCGYNDM